MLQGFRNGGYCQLGWACDWKIVNEQNKAILDMSMRSCFGFTLKPNSLGTCVMVVLLRFLMCPLEQISNGIRDTLNPFLSKSDFRSL